MAVLRYWNHVLHGVLAAMVSIALDMVIRVSASFWMTALLNKLPVIGASSDGMTSQALQQGGMGLIFTTLILAAHPMAAMFFQGHAGWLRGIFADRWQPCGGA